MKRIGAWYLIYNLDGTFRGYEGIRYDEDGNALASQVYAQEGRDANGKPLSPAVLAGKPETRQ